MSDFLFFLPLIVFIPVLGLVIWNMVNNPMKVEKVKVIKKTPGGFGKFWYITIETNGEVKELRAKYYVFMNVNEGEEVTLWYRGDYCFRFSK